MSEKENSKNPTMGFNEMGAQGNTLWITAIAEKIGATKLIEKGKDPFSGTYEIVAGSIGAVVRKVCDYYNSQFH